MKKKIIILIILIGILTFGIDIINAAGPDVKCDGLPGCESGNPDDKKGGAILISGIVAQLIQYTAVVAVISLMLSGMFYLVSGGEEEKVNKAKKWIIWSLVGVFISISAMGIIQAINAITI